MHDINLVVNNRNRMVVNARQVITIYFRMQRRVIVKFPKLVGWLDSCNVRVSTITAIDGRSQIRQHRRTDPVFVGGHPRPRL